MKRFSSFIYIHRTYIQQFIAHQLICACITGVGRAHNSWYASAQQLLCGWKYRLLRLIALILPATSKGYSEDFLRKTDATMIVLTSNNDSTFKVQRRYWEVTMIVLTPIFWISRMMKWGAVFWRRPKQQSEGGVDCVVETQNCQRTNVC